MNVNDPNFNSPDLQQPDRNKQNYGMPPVKQESWLKQNGLWFIPLLIVVLGVPVVCCGSVILGFGKLASVVSKPRDVAVEYMQRDRRVTDVLGTPLVATGTIQMNNMNVQNNTGETDLAFGVKGPNGTASVEGRMVMIGGQWKPKKLTATCSDGTEIIIPENAEIEDSLE